MNATMLISAFLLGAPTLKEKAKDSPWLGSWRLESTTVGGLMIPPEVDQEVMEFQTTGLYTTTHNGKMVDAGKFSTSPVKGPTEVEVISNSQLTLHGIIKVEGDILTLCLGQGPTSPRPTEFASPKGSKNMLFVYKRVRKKD